MPALERPWALVRLARMADLRSDPHGFYHERGSAPHVIWPLYAFVLNFNQCPSAEAACKTKFKIFPETQPESPGALCCLFFCNAQSSSPIAVDYDQGPSSSFLLNYFAFASISMSIRSRMAM